MSREDQAIDETSKLERRVIAAAESALDDQKYVSAVDVLVGLGWVAPSNVDRWRQGRIDVLDRVTAGGPDKRASALEILRRWASDRGLVPSEIDYVARTPDRRHLQFSETGAPEIEREYRTHWMSPALSEPKRQRLVDKQSKPPDLLVISPVKDWRCTNCEGTGDLLIMEGDGPLCMTCADLDHLVFLPSGDAAITRRAKKASRLSAVVVRFSRTRKRYERQGLLVEEDALAAAEESSLADEEVRRRRRERAEEARVEQDVAFQDDFAAEISRVFPGCPLERARAIARHAGARSSGRVGRSAAGRALDPSAVTAAVVASVRHVDTEYDDLLMSGVERSDARNRVRGTVDRVLDGWRGDRPPRHLHLVE